MEPNGLFITFEGGDGAGKTTQIGLLTDWLNTSRKHPPLVTREPGGSPLGVSIRQMLLHGTETITPRAEALLFAADRAHHVASVIRPALEAGRDVVCDRYIDSSVAYQGAGRVLDAQEVENLSLWASDNLVPDLTVLLDIPVAVGRARRGQVQDTIESEADEFHERVRQGFLRPARRDPSRYLVLDAQQHRRVLQAAIHERVASLLTQ